MIQCSRPTISFLQRLRVACLALVIGPSLLADDGSVDVARLIADLSSDDFLVRQRATAQLQQAGEEALPHVLVALRSPNSEVRSRSWNILLAQALSPRADVRESARSAIRQLEQQPGR